MTYAFKTILLLLHILSQVILISIVILIILYNLAFESYIEGKVVNVYRWGIRYQIQRNSTYTQFWSRWQES